jgi:hypothetical protein
LAEQRDKRLEALVPEESFAELPEGHYGVVVQVLALFASEVAKHPLDEAALVLLLRRLL